MKWLTSFAFALCVLGNTSFAQVVPGGTALTPQSQFSPSSPFTTPGAASAASASQRLSHTYNVVDDFGAKGDGRDDGPAFRAAIAACEAAPGYGKIIVPQAPVGYAINSVDPQSTIAGLVIGGGTLSATTGATSASSSLLQFSAATYPSSPYPIAVGMTVTDVTNPNAITGGQTVASFNSTNYSVTLSANVNATVAAGDVLQFSASQAQTSSTCQIEGVADNSWGNWAGGVNFKLGAGLNRPLLYVQSGAASPTLTNLRLDGNRSAQTGWTGGPSGALYTVQIADGIAYPEGSIRGENLWLIGGYNGNLYIGAGRGATYLKNLWSQYSGQYSYNASIVLNGYDGAFLNLQVGPNTGTGISVNEGTQYQFSMGAIFQNANHGILINGGHVNYLSMSDVQIGANGCDGIHDVSAGMYAGSAFGGHTFTNISFNGNSATTNNTCYDVYADSTGNNPTNLISLVNPTFVGASPFGNYVAYNIYDADNAITGVLNPQIGGTVAAATTAATSPSSAVLTFSAATYPPAAAVGMTVLDLTTPTAITSGQTISSVNPAAHTITLSGNVNATINSGDNVQFSGKPVSAVTGYTNSPRSIRGAYDAYNDYNIGPASPSGESTLTVSTATQYSGMYLGNGSNVSAALIGFSSTNDNGGLKLALGGIANVQLLAWGASYFNGGNVAFGGTSASYPVDVTGQVRTTAAYLNSSPPPSLSSCGTSPSTAAGSSNQGGQITLGTGAPTACAVTFANAYPTYAFCTLTPASAYTGTYYLSGVSKSGFTINLGTGTSSAAFNYGCNGN